MQLSKRLQCVADCVTAGNVTADIGCDHAFTSIYLVNNGIAPRVLAMDVNDGPLEHARNNIKNCGMDKLITVRKSDGIRSLTMDDGVKTILISGMGGNLITEILGGNNEILNSVDELVLQPQSEIFRVRHFLHEAGYNIVFEKMIFDEKKYYNIIKAVRGYEQYDCEYEYTYGKYLIDNNDAVFMEYLSMLYNKNIKIVNNIADKQSERVTEITKENEVIKEILNKIT